MVNSYHTHLAFCKHAEGYAEDYIKKAIEFNIKEIGITDHIPVPNYFYDDLEFKRLNNNTKMDYNEINDYLFDVINVKNKYKNNINVYVGFECEYYDKIVPILNELRPKVDYFVLGIHHYYYENKINTFYNQDDYIRNYGNIAIEALDSKLFKIFAHPDMFLWGVFGKPFNKLCIEVTRKICEAAIKNNVYLEINCNKIREYLKNGNSFLYPNENFWKIVSEYKDIKVIVSSDAHKPQFLYDEAVKYAYEWGRKFNLNIVDKIDI